jgi:NADPH:quinone reductase-like Zn-dependent oxidoreductase
MKAAVLHELGKVPHYEVFPDPVVQEDEIVVEVRAAALKPIDRQMATGSHYAAARNLPVVCGTDGVGLLEDGRRIFFAGPRSPYGAMAERTVIPKSRCVPIPDSVDDVTAAALFNPGLSAWGALVWRAQLAAGENVLILGATGVTGKLAIQTAKVLGARRVVAAGRNESVLSTLRDLGADATIRLGQSSKELSDNFAHEAGDGGFDVVVDFLWGSPTEAFLAATTRGDFKPAASRTRLVEVGESAGKVISLPAAVLRSSRLEILGAGSGSAVASAEMWGDAIRNLLANVSAGKIRIETERVRLEDVNDAWSREVHGRRVVLIP